MPKRIAILGGGIAGLSAAYELTLQQQRGANLTFTLFEQSDRLGGIVQTTRVDGFVLEGGADGWVSEKPWARELAIELGLESELVPSNDAQRVTYILRDGQLQAMPDGMRMMVPTDLDALDQSPLFSAEARMRYREEPGRAEELRRNAPQQDESVASFVKRHFGTEILTVIGAPLLNGVFGGDVHKLSVQAVMQPFVQMEREHGSLIVALQQRARERGNRPPQSIFTSLRNGTASLTDALAERLDPGSLRLQQRVQSMVRDASGWKISLVSSEQDGSDSTLIAEHATSETFDAVMLALPVYETKRLLANIDPAFSNLLEIPGSSALTVAYAFPQGAPLNLPQGFGFLAIEGQQTQLLAATFADQKFPSRAPAQAHAVRVYYGGDTADAMHTQDVMRLALEELQDIIGPLPAPLHSTMRYWPRALPQYHVGHLDRMAELNAHITQLGNVFLLGNGYRGVGLPDLVRDARNASRCMAQ